METIENLHWIMRENTLEVSLLKSYVKIIPRNYNLDLQIYEDGVHVALSLKFLNYEEAIAFTQSYIRCRKNYYPTIEDIKNKYNELYGEKNINIEKPKMRAKSQTNRRK